MAVDWLIVSTVAGPVLGALIGGYVVRWIERRPHVVAYYGHVSAFRLNRPEGAIPVHTHSVVISNTGGKTALNVRLGHNFLPDFRVDPPVEHCTVDLEGEAREILIPRLVPREQVTISYLYFPPLLWNQINTYAKSDEGLVHVVRVLLQRQFPIWFNAASGFFLVIGVISTIYLAVEVLRHSR